MRAFLVKGALFGFILGFFLASVFFLPELRAQYGSSSGSGAFEEVEMEPPVPAKYGRLVAVKGIEHYFQAKDGTVTVIKPRSPKVWDSVATVIKRSE